MSIDIYKVVFVNHGEYFRNTITYHVEAEDWQEAGKKAEKQFDKDYTERDNFIIGEIEITDINLIPLKESK